MRALPERLHAQLIRSTLTLSFNRQFDLLRQSAEVLSSFTEAQALIAHLHGRHGGPEDKNGILAALIRAAQGPRDFRECAGTLLWLALWPGCDALYRRLHHHFRGDPEELVARIAARMTREIASLDLAHVSRIAATVLMNIERDIRRELAGEHREKAAASVATDAFTSTCAASGAGEDVARLLSQLSAPDADLVVAVVIAGETQAEAARRLGASHEAVRKRLQRALKRLSAALEDFSQATCPTPGPKAAFTQQTFAKKGSAS